MSVYVALGSNLGDRAATLDAAVRAMGELPGVRVRRRSSTHVTRAMLPPEDPRAQPDYFNAVVELETQLAPRALLQALKQLEVRLGRMQATRWAAREIDLDLLLWDDAVVNEPDFQVPHPGLATRRFVLAPLAELAPDLMHPVLRQTIEALLAAAPLKL